LPTPPGVKRIEVQTAREMHHLVLQQLPGTHLAIMAAAVADYRPASEAPMKMKKGKGPISLKLVPNPDILFDVLQRRTPVLRVVGFAAETNSVDLHAKAKLQKKPCDVLAVNRVGKKIGMETLDNQIRLFLPGQKHTVDLGKGLKVVLASRMADFLQERFNWESGSWSRRGV
jgi:phosphopantothenoylcysteine decarboxylase/phosphopantothenate--cysteine ligase